MADSRNPVDKCVNTLRSDVLKDKDMANYDIAYLTWRVLAIMGDGKDRDENGVVYHVEKDLSICSNINNPAEKLQVINQVYKNLLADVVLNTQHLKTF